MDQKTQFERVGTAPTTTCARCGAVAEELPLTWTCSVENGSRVYFCDDCARTNIRSIEGRLDSSWW
ncbi:MULTISPECIES: hypothetical protein [Streptomycetaceae]|uniref:hypothetical protein n=1 Tax=Streptomycetaceae TaxID=2062 RepID=UPI0003A618FD|nr:MULTISPECIES: hypothetical protein [Streptomycetaceae]MYX35541.1 hypothetical protein [Streptomyces sp. SID8377]